MVAYRVEYAKSARAKCVGPICSKLEPKTSIGKDEFRFGTWVEIEKLGQASFKWRHYGCITPKILENLKKEYKSLENEFDGFDELTTEDAKRLKKAIEAGHLEDEDMTPDTRPPKTSKGDAKTEPADVDASSPKEATPKKPAATKRKPAASKEEASEETVNKQKATPAKKKAAPRKKSTKEESEEEEEAVSSVESEPESEPSVVKDEDDEESVVEEEEEEQPKRKKAKAAPKKAVTKKAAPPAKKRKARNSKAQADDE